MYKRKKHLALVLCATMIMGLFCCSVVHAESTVVPEVTVEGRLVTIEGQVTNVTGQVPVTLLVGDSDYILYIDQVKCSTSGAFEFRFLLPSKLPIGEYSYRIGGKEVQLYTGTIHYQGETFEKTQKVADTALNISVTNYVPTVAGTLYCGNGCSIDLTLKNTTNNTIIGQETVTPSTGNTCNISYTLPSLLQLKEYDLTVTYRRDAEVLAQTSIRISSYFVLVSAEGTIRVGDNVTVNAQIKSVGSDLIDKSITVTKDKTISGTLPNLVANASFEFYMEAYETLETTDDIVECVVLGVADDIAKVVAMGKNIETFENKTFEVKYDPTQLEAVSLWGFRMDDEVGIGKRDDVQVVSYTPGSIIFKLTDKPIPDGKIWTGVMNIFKFKLIGDYSDGAVITIASKEGATE